MPKRCSRSIAITLPAGSIPIRRMAANRYIRTISSGGERICASTGSRIWLQSSAAGRRLRLRGHVPKTAGVPILKHSIYVHPDHLHCGIGRALLPALADACAAAGYRQMIGYIDASNQPSLRLHEAYGFKQVGYLPSIGFKFKHWSDVVMVQRSLGTGGATPPDIWPAVSAGDD
jgi:GNAT superfamily N-acetyltransferase